MVHKILKFIVGTALGLAVALLVAFNALLLWVATGPRTLDRLSPYIAASFRTPHQEFSVKIGETWLIWDGWKHPIDIRLKNVTVLTKEGQVFSEFPQISVGIDIFSLLEGRILPTSLSIAHPSISLFQNEDRSISFGFGHEESSPQAAPMPNEVPFAAMLAPLVAPDETNPLHKLRVVTILDADVSIANVKKGVFFTASEANITFRHDHNGMSEAAIGAKITYGANVSTVDAEFAFTKGNPVIDGEMHFSRLMPATLAALFSDNKALLAAKFPLSGKSKLSLDMNGTVQRVNFAIDGGKGNIESGQFEKPLDVDALHVEGQLSNNASDIQVDNFTAEINKSTLTADNVIVSFSNGDVSVRGDATLSNVQAGNVHLLWPPALSPESRDWVVTNITDGKVTSAGIHINIPFGDRAKPQLPKEDIDAAVTLEGAKIRYLPEHPEVTHVKGVVHVNAVSLDANIQSGDWLKDTKLSNGKVLIDDLNAPNPYIKVSLDADASAKDIVKLLGLPRLKHAEQLNLHEDSAEGSAHGHAELGFHFEAPRDEQGRPVDDITYNISADAKDITTPGLLKKFDIKNSNGKLIVDNNGLEFKGSGEVNSASVSTADIKYLFKPDKGLDTFIDVTATAPVESLPRFGYPKFPFLKGTLGVKASLKQGDMLQQSQAGIDLTDAVITLPDFGWTKPDKQPASLDLTSEKKNGVVTFPTFYLHGKDMEARGAAELNADLSDFKHVELKQLRYGQNDLDSVIYEPRPGGWHIEAHGDSADLTGWLGGDSGDQSFSFVHFPVLELKGDIGRLVLGKGRELSYVKADVNCDAQLCSNVNVGGKTVDGKPFTFRILRNPKNMRQLSIHAQSAGAFIKACGVFDGIEGGDLTIIGNYDEHDKGSALKGKADITAYTVHKAPILAKILSLASLSGVFDMLGGNGIAFDKFTAPFTLSKDVITVEDAKTHGDAIGMTIEGTITFPKKTLDLKGTVIPSYSLNTVLGDVPLIGHMLTGGSGQGVFAARYSISGSTKDPDVSVNPLSILTPGFLRGVFDILDTGPSKKKTDEDGDESQ